MLENKIIFMTGGAARKDYVGVEWRIPPVVKALEILGFEAEADREETLRRACDFRNRTLVTASAAS